MAAPTNPSTTQKRIWVPIDITISVGEGTSDAPATTSASSAPLSVLGAELNYDDDYANRAGYDEAFLGKKRRVPMPTILDSASNQVAPTLDGDTILHYHHFSLATHAERRMPILTAQNVDYRDQSRSQRGRKSYGKDDWRLDARLDEKYQIPVAWYRSWKKLDYGHLVRREDNCWGSSDQEIEFANADTFHMTNCTPQHEAFNRANLRGLWGKLEGLIDKEAHDVDRGMFRFCLFAGPIFRARKDLLCGDVRVPLSFWKVLVIPEPSNHLSVYGFILEQKDVLDDDPPFEAFEPGEFSDRVVNLEEIEKQTVVRFDQSLKDAQATP